MGALDEQLVVDAGPTANVSPAVAPVAPTTEPAPDTSRAASFRVVDRVVDPDVDQYTRSVARVDLDAVRAGPAVGPSRVVTVTGGPFDFTESTIGVPMLSRTTIPDGQVLVATVRSASAGSRWCEIPLSAGQVVIMGPGAEYAGRNLPGLDFAFAICDVAEITQHAERLKARLEVPPSGEVHLLPATPATELVGSAFGVFADAASSGTTPSIEHLDDVMCAMVHSLSESDRTRRIGCGHRIDSRHIVLTAIDFAEAVDRIPSVSELCAITHLSERRLRQAFTDEYDMPPSRFFRAWALGEAHRRLASANAADQTVTRVATALGFDHLGRFSGHYSEIFDEHPSDTLRSAS